MPFYLRKSLSFGPVRFNLSKGGVGVSAGVTGARVGLNKNGAYVHGGRHGLYYREKLGKKRRSGRAKSSSETVELFVDTGETYTGGKAVDKVGEAGNTEERAQAETKSLAYPFYFAALGLGIAGISAGNVSVLILAAVVAALGPVYRSRKQTSAENKLQEAAAVLAQLDEAERPVDVLREMHKQPLPKPFRHQRDKQIAEAALLLYVDSSPNFDKSALQEFLPQLSINADAMQSLKKEIFDDLLDAFIADHIITKEEEQHLEQVIADFNLQEDDIAPQRYLMRQLIKLREGIESGFEPVSCPLKLTRNEECYYATEGKQLKQRVLDSFQREGVRYKQVGYETEKSGTIYLTNKQIYIVDSGVRSIRLNTILDITCSLEDNTLHLSLNNRVNPIILSVPETTAFAACLNYFAEQA